jgi:hypothetical protein
MKKKKVQKEEEKDPLAKLVRLTKLMKIENVRVAPKGSTPRYVNKWRSQDPKFAPKREKPGDVVEAGGMQVDPSVKDEYDLWRQDKIREQNERREQFAREKAAKRARYAKQREIDAGTGIS